MVGSCSRCAPEDGAKLAKIMSPIDVGAPPVRKAARVATDRDLRVTRLAAAAGRGLVAGLLGRHPVLDHQQVPQRSGGWGPDAQEQPAALAGTPARQATDTDPGRVAGGAATASRVITVA
jgi:hypothetical protein